MVDWLLIALALLFLLVIVIVLNKNRIANYFNNLILEEERINETRASLVNWQQSFTVEPREIESQISAIDVRANEIRAALPDLHTRSDALSLEWRLVDAARTAKLNRIESEMTRLEESPPEGFVGYEIRGDWLTFKFASNNPRRPLRAKINLQTGKVEGPMRPWSLETLRGALQAMHQGRINTLARMAFNSLEGDTNNGSESE